MARRRSCQFWRIEQAGVYPSLLPLPLCFLLDLVLQLLLKLLLLSRSAHGHAVRLKIPHPLRTARVPTIVLLSRGTPPCCTGGGRRLMPTGLSWCLAFDAGLHLNHFIESKALLQYRRP